MKCDSHACLCGQSTKFQELAFQLSLSTVYRPRSTGLGLRRTRFSNCNIANSATLLAEFVNLL